MLTKRLLYLVIGVCLAEAGTLFYGNLGDSNNVCPDKSTCDDYSTCCQLITGRWGCCPFPKADCCPDHMHCCPYGEKCDKTKEQCLSASGVPTRKWALKVSATPPQSSPDLRRENVVCPDKSTCDDYSTCCQLITGYWGCCPFPRADCCSDHMHCCPYGEKCDVAEEECVSSSGLTTRKWALKLPATPPKSSPDKLAEEVMCPDLSKCSPGAECCQTDSFIYHCCKLPESG